MRHLSIDIETKSSVDIGKAGAYRYAQSPDFGILLFAFGWDGSPVQVVDFAQGVTLPADIRDALSDPNVVKHAYNAAFEWYSLNRGGYRTPLGQWRCTMAHSLYCGYVASLEAAGRAMGIPQDKQKLTAGKALIRYFCTPCKPTMNNGGRVWNLPGHAPEKWTLFKEYCMRDVEAEREILKRLRAFPMPDEEIQQWRLTVSMNAYGVRVDTGLVQGALHIDGVCRSRLMDEAERITGLD